MVVLENSQNLLPRAVRHIHASLLSAIVAFVALSMAISGAASAAPNEDAARRFFGQLVAAQNAHDATQVLALLWDSPDVLWFTRGVEVRGKAAIADELAAHFAGTWHLEPDMSHFRWTATSEDTGQILVPIAFTRGRAGQPAQTDTFLISQTLVRDSAGWHVAAILPIANTQLK
jgi:hypothetical protein